MNEKLKSYWMLDFSDIQFPTLLAAKNALLTSATARIWANRGTSIGITHVIGYEDISIVKATLSTKGHWSFSRPQKLTH